MNTAVFRKAFTGLFALSLAAVLSLPARGMPRQVTVLTNGVPLVSDTASFILNGTTYIPLAAWLRQMGVTDISWDGEAAHARSAGLSVTAAPGRQWVEANGRALYVPHEVQLNDGRVMVPVRVAAALFGAEVAWDADTFTVSVSGGSAPLPHADEHYDPDTLYWLSRVISAESRGEALVGQIAVGNVVLNRLKSPAFPNSLYGVIFQPDQFEPVENGTIYQEPYHLSVTAAKLVLEGAVAVEDCLYFFAPALSPGTWIVENRTYHTSIGCHDFYL